MAEKTLIVPVSDVDSREFWAGCKRRELLIRRCGRCGSYRYPPDPGCHNCGSLNSTWVKIRGEGTIFTYTIIPYSTHPAFRDRVPYNVIVVNLPEAGDVHMVSTLVECSLEDIYVGMPVEVVFEEITPEVTLPFFRPAGKGGIREPALAGMTQANRDSE